MPLIRKPESKKEAEENGGVMTVSGHLKELRNRIAVVLIVFVLASAVFITFADKLVTLFTDMGISYGYNFVYIKPQELLLQQFRVALLGSFFVTLPLILFEIYSYARPGLSRRESRTFAFTMVFGVFFFMIGLAFAYFITIPFMLNFLIRLGDNSIFQATISIESYLSFVLLVFTIFGFIFEMPLVSIILSRFGILSPKALNKARPMAIIVIFIVAAIITPPDVVSQIMVALPMLALYFLSTLLSKVFYKKREVTPEEAEELAQMAAQEKES